MDDALTFRPNPEDFISDEKPVDEDEPNDKATNTSNVYRPPRLAPVPYVDDQEHAKKKRRVAAPTALSSLQLTDASAPYTEKSTGLSATTTLHSAHGRRHDAITQYEEDNFMRLNLSKKEAKQRRRIEEDLALGGPGGTGRGRARGGLEDEFRDVLSAVDRPTGSAHDAYDELRRRGSKKSLTERSRDRDAVEEVDSISRKKARFEVDVKKYKKKSKQKK